MRVMRYFRSGLSRQSTEEIDRLENYILATGIRGIGSGIMYLKNVRLDIVRRP